MNAHTKERERREGEGKEGVDDGGDRCAFFITSPRSCRECATLTHTHTHEKKRMQKYVSPACLVLRLALLLLLLHPCAWF